MHRIILLAILLPLFGSAPKSPEDFVWQNRILIVKSEMVFDKWPLEKISQKLDERKLLVFQFLNNELIDSNYREKINSVHFFEKIPSAKISDTQWVLIGLDGGIKKSGEGMPNPEEIFKVIDAMPMRQSEFRKSSN